MYYLIVAEGNHEYVLCSGRREDLERMARQLRAERLFRYVRVDASVPPGVGKHPPPHLGDHIPEVGNRQH